MRPGLPIMFAFAAAASIAFPATAHGQDHGPEHEQDQSLDQELIGRFAASRASLTSYVGSGTFVANRYSDDPLFSQALSLQPRFAITGDLAIASHFELECELTTPDHPNARRCAAGDLSLAAHARVIENLHARLAAYFPTSPESRFNHTVLNVRATADYSLKLFDDRFSAGASFGVQKYLPSQRVRGFTTGDETNTDFPIVLARRSAAEDGAVGSGGRMNDNWSFISSANVGWQFTDELSAAVSVGIYNYLRYSVRDDFLADPTLPLTGRADVTSGNIQASWTPLEHFALDLGLSSVQPALTADGKSLRFPFYDFISPSNNFSRWYLAVHFTY